MIRAEFNDDNCIQIWEYTPPDYIYTGSTFIYFSSCKVKVKENELYLYNKQGVYIGSVPIKWLTAN